MTPDELVKEALSLSETGSPGTPEVTGSPGSLTDDADTGFLVIGTGTAGTKITGRLNRVAGPGLRTLAIDFNPELSGDLSGVSRFTLRPSHFSGGFGLCGGDPDLADRYREATENASPEIEQLVGNPAFCFIVAGMGGNTGTGSAPVIARMMRKRGSVVTALVTSPFSVERQRKARAARGIRELCQAADTVLILDFEKLKAALPTDMPLADKFNVMDHIIALSIRNLWEGTRTSAFVPLRSGDLQDLLKHGGTGTLLLGEFDEKSGKRISLEDLRVPLLDFPDTAVKACIIHITGGYDLGLFESDEIATGMSRPFGHYTDVIWGASVRKEMEGKLRLFTLVTGLNFGRRVRQKSLEEWLAGH